MSAIGDSVTQYPASGTTAGLVIRGPQQAANATVTVTPIPGVPTPIVNINANRLGAVIANDTSQDVYVQLHNPTDYSFALKVGSASFYELKGHVGNKDIFAWAQGASWTSGSPNNPNYITGIFGWGSNAVLAGDASGSLWFWNGTTWSTGTLPGSNSAVSGGRINGVWGVSSTDIWVNTNSSVISHFSGNEWIAYPGLSVNSFAPWGSGPNDVWFPKNLAGTTASAFYHWDGVALALEGYSGTNGNISSLVSAWGFAQNNVWAVGNYINNLTGSIFHFDGAHWNLYTTVTASTNVTIPGTGLYILQGIWGANPNDIWAAGRGGALYHYTGSTGVWSPVFVTDAISQLALTFGSQIFGTGPKDVWFPMTSGSSVTVPMWGHWNGFSMITGTIPGNDPAVSVAETKVYQAAQNDVWMGSSNQPIIHWAGVSGNLMVTELS